ncbi:AAA family ATPase [Patescibacteria group bacterium]|nr:AAA family ATPase [Patescibacteria group bacterium]
MIIGHQDERAFLKKIFASVNAGGFLLIGPAGIGKFSLVKELAQARVGRIDLVLIDSAEASLKLGLAKKLRNISLLKTGSIKRVIIINNAQRLNEEAQNLFLKTIEDLNSNTLFFFVADQAGALRATIRSRLEPIRFKPVPFELINQGLKGRFKPNEIKAAYAFWPGQVGAIISFLTEPAKFNLIKKVFDGNGRLDQLAKLKFLLELEKTVDLEELIANLFVLEQKNIMKLKKSDLTRIKFLFKLYSDSRFYLNKGLQMSNLFLNYYV